MQWALALLGLINESIKSMFLTFPHIQMPNVSGLSVGPTLNPNPLFLPMSWLSRKDLPEWYLPTTATTATAPDSLCNFWRKKFKKNKSNVNSDDKQDLIHTSFKKYAKY